ncbi:MAG TPA: DUF2891 domain-containing protein [Pyrinomonadaceae bacterium]|nr:DUF2891 domain-containing protein [Pyrinomonadaceae bacterium]
MRGFRTSIVLCVLLLAVASSGSSAEARPAPAGGEQFALTQAQASHFARLALRCARKEYPNKIEHTLNDESQVRPPKALHPAFYGCYDWHSSVHGHWLLARLLRLYPSLPEAREIREALDANLTPENVRAEDEYFKAAGRQSFERPYGWAWLLKLHEELYTWDDADARRWFSALQPLADTVVGRYIDFFAKQTYPIRVGTHFNSAFGLSFALDYAKTVKSDDPARRHALETLMVRVVEASRKYYLADANYPAAFEPGGDDFLSGSLIEADLMRRALPAAEFRRWLRRFLPGLAQGRPENLLNPAVVSDRSDPKIVHLDGLNLSRAWCMRNIAASLPRTDPARRILARSANRHAAATLKYVASGNYEGEHWLASFAVYMLTTPDPGR